MQRACAARARPRPSGSPPSRSPPAPPARPATPTRPALATPPAGASRGRRPGEHQAANEPLARPARTPDLAPPGTHPGHAAAATPTSLVHSVAPTPAAPGSPRAHPLTIAARRTLLTLTVPSETLTRALGGDGADRSPVLRQLAQAAHSRTSLIHLL